jgi:cell division protein ZapA (FtsZ GTPase activity inhibitor)
MAVNAYSREIQREIEDNVGRLAKEFDREIARIRFSVEENWTGQNSIFLRIVLKEPSAAPGRLRQVTRAIDRRVSELFSNLEEQGLYPFAYFRSEAEPESKQEPKWV